MQRRLPSCNGNNYSGYIVSGRELLMKIKINETGADIQIIISYMLSWTYVLAYNTITRCTV